MLRRAPAVAVPAVLRHIVETQRRRLKFSHSVNHVYAERSRHKGEGVLATGHQQRVISTVGGGVVEVEDEVRGPVSGNVENRVSGPRVPAFRVSVGYADRTVRKCLHVTPLQALQFSASQTTKVQ